MKDLYLDESGWGCPVGGVTIGLMDENGEGSFVTIPPPYFQDGFMSDDWRECMLEFIENMFLFTYKDGDKVHMCRGPFFNMFARELMKWNVDFVREKITGKPQKSLERKNAEYLRDPCGIDIKSYTGHGGRSFKWYIQWIKDHPEKKMYVKTGWRGLEKWIKDKS